VTSSLLPSPAMAAVDVKQPINSDLGAPTKGSKTGAEELIRSFTSVAPEEGEVAKGNVKVLCLSSFLFAFITAVQWWFGAHYKSGALIQDCKSMLVDALSYFLNIWAELAPLKWKKVMRLVIPALSLSILAFIITYWGFPDAIQTIRGVGGDADPIPAWVPFLFGFAGIIFDVICIVAFWKNSKKSTLPVNMLAAFMHVGADFLRSTSTTIEGIIIAVMSANDNQSALVDAWNTIVVTVLIYIGIFYGLYEVVVDVRDYCKGQ